MTASSQFTLPVKQHAQAGGDAGGDRVGDVALATLQRLQVLARMVVAGHLGEAHGLHTI